MRIYVCEHELQSIKMGVGFAHVHLASACLRSDQIAGALSGGVRVSQLRCLAVAGR